MLTEDVARTGRARTDEHFRPDGGDWSIVLTYHQIAPAAAGYRYQVRTTELQRHLRLAESLDNPFGFTFDDGYVSQFENALPLLQTYKVRGIFFLTTGRIERLSEYMAWSQVKELAAAGQTVGSHSLSHPFLNRCSEADLKEELSSSKKTIEDRLGIAVTDISMPGGRWNRRVLEACRESGYSRVFTSDPWACECVCGMAVIGRFNITGGFSADALREIVYDKRGWVRKQRAIAALKSAVRVLVGDRAYHALWRRLNHMEDEEDQRA